jgi:hypothetical protein
LTRRFQVFVNSIVSLEDEKASPGEGPVLRRHGLFLGEVAMARVHAVVVASILLFGCSSLPGGSSSSSAMASSPGQVGFEVDGVSVPAGASVYVVGDGTALGVWKPAQGAKLTQADNASTWSATLNLPVGASVQFKFALVDGSGNVTLETGANRTVTATDGAAYLGEWNQTAAGNIVTGLPVTLTSPSSSSGLSGTATLSASVGGGLQVTQVDYYVDGALVGTDSTGQGSVSWDSTTVPNGNHVFSATATDAAGNLGTATGVTAMVSNVSPMLANEFVGAAGGTVDHLYFAMVGDTRPSFPLFTSYPTAIITQIFTDIQGMNPRPQFVVATGDYQFSIPLTGQSNTQVGLYRKAEQAFSGTVFSTMGNHECTGLTQVNCSMSSLLSNIPAYMNSLVLPLGQTLPYYTVPFNGSNGSWNAKLIVVACNLWDPTQKAWLADQLAQPTTYTLIAQHQPSTTTDGPCVNDVNALLANHPYSLSLVGHDHEFAVNGREVKVGISGAPLSSGASNWGYATVEQTSKGWVVTEYDYATAAPLATVTVPL